MGIFTRRLAISRHGDGLVFTGSDSPVILSGGVPLKLTLSTAEASAAINLVEPSGRQTVLLTGGVAEVSEAYVQACADLRQPNSRGITKDKAKLLSIGVAAVIVSFFLAGAYLGSIKPTAPVPGDLNAMLEELTRQTEALRPQAQQDAVQEAPEAAQPAANMSPVLDRPDFLKVPDVLPPLEEPATHDASKEKWVAPPSIGLPAWSPEMYENAASAEAEAKTAGNAGAEGQETAAAPESSSEDIPTPPADATPDVSTVGGTPEATTEAMDSAKAGEPVTVTSKPGDENGNAEAKPEPAAASNSVDDFAKAKDEAKQAVKGLIDRGMTPDGAADVLRQLEELSNSDFAQITPEMLAKLPHEIAHMLVEGGLVKDEEDAPNGVPHRIIRLPEKVLEKYRGPDGIPTIPEANTWVSTGNFVNIPLPGGGDIKTPEDMKEFSLEPGTGITK